MIDARAAAQQEPISAGNQPGETESRIPYVLEVALETECVIDLLDSCRNRLGAGVVGRHDEALEAAARGWGGVEMGHIDIAAESVCNPEVAYVLIAQTRVDGEPSRDFVVVLNVAVTTFVAPVAREVPEALQRLVDVAISRSVRRSAARAGNPPR